MADITETPAYERLSPAPRAAPGAGAGDPGSADMDIRFDAGPAAASAARAALGSLERAVDPVALEDMQLLVSELVTNSIRHAETAVVRLRVRVRADRVHVEVSDGGRGFVPAPQAPGTIRPGGWGLYIVDRLATRWGVARDGLTRVWFEMSTRRGGGGALGYPL